MTKQSELWKEFSEKVDDHISDYVVPQWGDIPQDQVSEYEQADYKANLMRYVGRIGKGQRGKTEELRDCLKIAHYASRYYDYLKNKEVKNGEI